MREIALVQALDYPRTVHDHLDLRAGLADDPLLAVVVIVVIHRRPVSSTPKVVLLFAMVSVCVGRFLVRAGLALPLDGVLPGVQGDSRGAAAVVLARRCLLVVELALGGDSWPLD